MTKQGREFMQRVQRGEFLSIPERASIAMKTLDVEILFDGEALTAVGQVREDGVAEATVYRDDRIVMKVDGGTYDYELVGHFFGHIFKDANVDIAALDVGAALHKAYPAFTSEREDA